MNFRLCTGLAALVCISLASCYPYNENQNKNRNKRNATTQKAKTPEEIAKEKEAEAKRKAEEEKKKAEAENNITPPENQTPGNTGGTPEGPKPPVENKPKSDYPVAQKVPGKEGYVFSPYNQKVIEVRDEQGALIPSGTLVQDPTFPASEKKYFRVP